MNRQHFDQWLAAYGRAWETRDAVAAMELFTPEALYYWTPFEEPKRGRDGIAEAWRAATSRQEEIHFTYEILAITGNNGLTRWSCSFNRLPTKHRVRLDGIFLVTMNADNLCEQFREWWHSDEA